MRLRAVHGHRRPRTEIRFLTWLRALPRAGRPVPGTESTMRMANDVSQSIEPVEWVGDRSRSRKEIRQPLPAAPGGLGSVHRRPGPPARLSLPFRPRGEPAADPLSFPAGAARGERDLPGRVDA